MSEADDPRKYLRGRWPPRLFRRGLDVDMTRRALENCRPYVCLAEDGRWTCSLPVGHEGDHMARGSKRVYWTRQGEDQ